MARKRKPLHQTPPEFAEAKETRCGRRWKENQERAERRAVRDRERVMPAHTKPKPFERFCAKGSSGRHTSKDPMWGYYEYSPKYRVKHITY